MAHSTFTGPDAPITPEVRNAQLQAIEAAAAGFRARHTGDAGGACWNHGVSCSDCTQLENRENAQWEAEQRRVFGDTALALETSSGGRRAAAARTRALRSDILHVNIIDEAGELLADVDAKSTADGLAYYLKSRRIVPDASEDRVRPAFSGISGKVDFQDTEEIVCEVRHPITRVLEFQCVAKVGR